MSIHSRINRVVVLLEFAPSPREVNYYGGVDILRRNGFQAEVWDLSRAVNHRVGGGLAVPDIDGPLRTFREAADACEALAQLHSSCFVVANFGYGRRSLRLFQSLSRSRANYGLTALGMLPRPVLRDRWGTLWTRTAGQNVDTLVHRIPPAWLGVRPARLMLRSGAAPYPHPGVSDSTEQLWVHALDYDTYLQEQQHFAEEMSEPSAVFLDNGMTSHPDYAHLVRKPIGSPADYYSSLFRMFDQVESRLGLKVVIAGHPRCNYDQLSHIFKSRPVIQDQTASLVRQSSLVLLHCSTAVNFAVLFERPLIFVTTDTIDSTEHGASIQALAKEFGKRPLNVDRKTIFASHQDLEVLPQIYREYRERYIKTAGSPELPAWQIIADRLLTLETREPPRPTAEANESQSEMTDMEGRSVERVN